MKSYTGKGYTIYCHENRINGKIYIGQTKAEDLTRRWTGGNGYKGITYRRVVITLPRFPKKGVNDSVSFSLAGTVPSLAPWSYLILRGTRLQSLRA